MKRFYKQVTTAPEADGWRVMLDGRGVKTVGSKPQVVPSQALAEALADEWAAQGEEIRTSLFVLRDMADFALDVVAPDPAAAVTAMLPYGETDTLCYRADPGEPVFKRQQEVWEPLLSAFEVENALSFVRISGIIHHAQAEETLARLKALLAGEDTFTLAALRSLTGLAQSLVIALLAIRTGADAEALWAAACLEEDFQAEFWGKDAEAQAHRARRFRDFAAAMRFVALLREG